MNILTFDTSLNKTFVSLSGDGNILSSLVIENHDEKYHSAYLIPSIVSILKENNISMQDINAIGTNIGPGSFTGIRACVTVARVIAQQLKCPLVGVSSLEILSRINKSDSKTILVLDARKNQYYTAVYEKDIEIQPPTLTAAEDVLAFDYSGACVIGDNAGAELLKQKDLNVVVYTELNENFGLYLDNLVCKKIENSKNVQDEYEWGKLKPLYLQAPYISVSKKIIPTS